MSVTKKKNIAIRIFGRLLVVIIVSLIIYDQVVPTEWELPRNKETCDAVALFGWYYADHRAKGATDEAAEKLAMNFLDGFVGVKGDYMRERYFKLGVQLAKNNWAYVIKDPKTADKALEQLCLAGAK